MKQIQYAVKGDMVTLTFDDGSKTELTGPTAACALKDCCELTGTWDRMIDKLQRKYQPLDRPEIVTRMKTEILRDIKDGRVPESVSSFGELHDHVDANDYGSVEILDPVRDIITLDWCQNEINRWLADGRP